MYCNKCGYRNDDYYSFCMKCGSALGSKEAPQKPKREISLPANMDTDSLLERAFIFLYDEEWNSADAYCDRVLDIEPKNTKAYLCKLLAEMRVKNEESLIDCDEAFDSKSSYQKLYKYSDDDYKKRLDDWRIERIYKQAERALSSQDYEKASELFRSIPEYKDSLERADRCIYDWAVMRFKKNDYLKAENLFKKIPEYKDSEEYIHRCVELAKSEKDTEKKDGIYNIGVKFMNEGGLFGYEDAIKEFEKISGYKNADELIAECKHKINVINSQKIEDEQKKRKKKIIFIISASTAAVILIAVIIGVILYIPYSKYNNAMALIVNNEYSKSLEILNKIPKYKDVPELTKYVNACIALKNEKNYDKAINGFSELENFRNSSKMLVECKYQKGLSFYNIRKYSDCIPIFLEIIDYPDSSKKLEKIYDFAVSYMDDRKFTEAAEILLPFGDYKDSADRVETIYQQALTYQKDEKYKYAAALFISLKDYKDSSNKIDEIYKKMVDLVNNKKYAEAAPALIKLWESGYSQAEEQVQKIYDAAVDYKNKYYYYSAIKLFESLGKYKNSKTLLAGLNDLYDPEKDKKYNKANKAFENGDYDEAEKLFKELGDYKNSSSKATEAANKEKASDYDYAVSLMNNGNYDDAKDVFSKLGNYKDAKSKIAEIEKKLASMVDISGIWHQVNDEGWNKVYIMEVNDYGDNNYDVRVEISDSAFVSYYWAFSGKFNKNTMRMDYDNGSYNKTTYLDDGRHIGVNLDFVYGSLYYSDGYLYWTCYGDCEPDTAPTAIRFEKN